MRGISITAIKRYRASRETSLQAAKRWDDRCRIQEAIIRARAFDDVKELAAAVELLADIVLGPHHEL